MASGCVRCALSHRSVRTKTVTISWAISGSRATTSARVRRPLLMCGAP